jgi:GNAT superfamily N-acetyltransferase
MALPLEGDSHRGRPAERGLASVVVCRRAGVDDIPAMRRIRIAVRENALSNPARITEAMYRDYLDALGRGWVAEQDGEVIGFSYADRTDSTIWALFVDPDREGRGAGKQLLRLAVDWLFELGNPEVRLGTAVHTRADRFYAAQGWTRGQMKDDMEVWYRLRRADRDVKRTS